MVQFIYIKSGNAINKCEVKEVVGNFTTVWLGFTETLEIDNLANTITYLRAPEQVYELSTEEAFNAQEAAEDDMWRRYNLAVENFGITTHSRTAKGAQKVLWDQFCLKYPTIKAAADSCEG